MKAVLADIQYGAFAERFINDQDAGAPEFKELRAKGENHPIEPVGRELRKLFAWVKPSRRGLRRGQRRALSRSRSRRTGAPTRGARLVVFARR